MKPFGRICSLLLVSPFIFTACTEAPVVRSVKTIKEKMAVPILKKADFKDYYSGLSMDYPDGWVVKDNSMEDQLLIHESMRLAQVQGSELPKREEWDQTMQTLLSVEKDEYNSLSITRQLFKEDYPGQYWQTNRALTDFIYESFAAQAVRVDTSSQMVSIGGKAAYCLSLTIYNEDGSTLMHQDNFSTLHQGQDISFSITYNNAMDHRTLVESLGTVKLFPRRSIYAKTE